MASAPSLLVPNARYQSKLCPSDQCPSAAHRPVPPESPTPRSDRVTTSWPDTPSAIPLDVKNAFASGSRHNLSQDNQNEDEDEDEETGRIDEDEGSCDSSSETSSDMNSHFHQESTTQPRIHTSSARAVSLAPYPYPSPSPSPSQGQNSMWVPPTSPRHPPLSTFSSTPPCLATTAMSRVKPIPTDVQVERYTPTPGPSRFERLEGTVSIRAGTPVNQPWVSDSLAMPPPPLPASASAKRKLSDLSDGNEGFQILPGHHPADEHNSNDDPGHSFSPTIIKSEISALPEQKPRLPISMLPIPLPSKRFKKGRSSRAVLIPVEQLPVFALPPLPTIDDPDLLKQVFSHQSLFERVRGRFEEPVDKPAKHYEKLEHVGDSILGSMVTTWLHETRPRLTPGSATKLKAHLVSNATLSHLSGLYNLPQRLNGDPNLLPVLRAHTDIRAALMEAYIAAIYFSFPAPLRITQALPVIDGWLREMYEPLYDFFYNYMKTEHDQHHSTIGAGLDGQVVMLSPEKLIKIDQAALGMAALVLMYGNKEEREVRFEEVRYETNMGVLYKITCLVDGIELGDGMRSTRKAGKNAAGWEAAKKLGLIVSQDIQQ